MRCRTLQWKQPSDWQTVTAEAGLDSKQTLVICFFAPELATQPQIFRKLKTLFPQSIIMGCSTAGEILGKEISDLSLTLLICQLEHSRLDVAVDLNPPADPSSDFYQNFSNSLRTPDVRGVLVLTEGLSTNGSQVARGISQQLPATLPVAGGLAADGDRFQQTHVLWDGEIHKHGLVAVAFSGERLSITNASRGGWDIFGPRRVVTKSRGNIVYEFDGKPALELYKSYLGEKASELPASGLLFPIKIHKSQTSDEVVRTLLGIDETTHSLRFAGDVPQGAHCQLMKANFNRLVAAAAEAGGACRGAHPRSGESSFCVAISCVGRRLVLRDRAENELEALHEELPPNEPVIGFYSYGELGSRDAGRSCELHNQSMTIFRVTEE